MTGWLSRQAAATAEAVVTSRPTLRRGSRGADVVDLQTRLNAAGTEPPLETDGIFGPRTERAVRDFQSARGLDSDGIVGPITWGALEAAGAVPDEAFLRFQAQFSAANAAKKAGDFATAAVLFETLYADPSLEFNPSEREGVLMNLAECRHRLGQFAEAISLYQEILDSPNFQFGPEGKRDKDRALFLELIREARLGLPPTSLAILSERQKARSEGKPFDEAGFARSMEITRAAHAAKEAGDFETAAARFQQAYADPSLEFNPSEREGVLMNLAECRHRLGQFAEAISLYQEILDSPNFQFGPEGKRDKDRALFLELIREARLRQPPTSLATLSERQKARR